MKLDTLKTKLTISILLFLSILIFFTLELLAKKDLGFIEWRAISAANGYRVEIKNETHKVILESNVNENIYYVDLPKGQYEFRIGILNFFKKPVVWSYWNPLRIIVSQQPVLDLDKLEVPQGTKAVLTGDHFLENTKLTLVNEGKNLFVENLILHEKNLTFPTDKLKIGIYDIILENPNNKILIKKNYLQINHRSKKPPEKTINKKDIAISSESTEKADITIDESVAGKTTLNIGPKTKEKLDITLENRSTEKVTVDINNRSQGKVNFNVENKSKENLALNINNHSKENFSVGLVDKSKGKIDVNVTEKSREKVEINTIFADIEYFDVTIENKAKSQFNINIGEPPIVFVPNKRTPAKVIDRKDIKISSDSLEKVDISVDDSISGKVSVNIGPNTKEDTEISLENRSKENVTVDINNNAEGKINLNVENKSTEKLALNVKNSSKENFYIGLVEKSIGKIETNVNENSKSKVEINTINADIENFDVTIENKTKDKFDINIGKKEIPPLVFVPSKETFPANYHKYTLKEYQNFVNGLHRTCASNLDVPDILIDKCHSRHVTLNLDTMDRKILYNFIKLGSGNYNSRISAYKFYIENCSPALSFIAELADFRLKNITQDEYEKFYERKTIEGFNNCKNKGER